MSRLYRERSSQAGRDYLHRRRIDAQTCDAWRLGTATVWHLRRKRHMDAILLPWFDQQHITAVQYRFIDPTLSKSERFGQLKFEK